MNVTNALIAAAVALTTPGARAQDSVPDPRIIDGLPEGYQVVDGDVLIPANNVAASFTPALWPSGNPTIIRYRFDTTGTDAVREDTTCPGSGVCRQTRMVNAMAQWEAVADIRFVDCGSACSGDFIHIRDSTNDTCGNPPIPCPANNSSVGRAGGQQTINITSWDVSFRIEHELGHALGLWHEQSRADRDTACNGGACVTIRWDNISQVDCSGESCDHNFEERDSIWGDYGPYDFDSLMHYAQCDFSACRGCPNTPVAVCNHGGRTITVSPPNDVTWQGAIGQRTHLSEWDARIVSFLYPPAAWRFLDARCGSTCSVFPVSCFYDGSFRCPYIWENDAIENTPAHGHLWIMRNEVFDFGEVLSKPLTIHAPLGARLSR